MRQVREVPCAPSLPLEAIRVAVAKAWSVETAVDRQVWTPQVPSRGQCAVTALVIQDLLGGVLLRVLVDGVSHYWNRLPTGDEVDLTRDQFETFSLDAPADERTRDYVLSNPHTGRRYRILKERVIYPGHLRRLNLRPGHGRQADLYDRTRTPNESGAQSRSGWLHDLPGHECASSA